VNISVVVPTLNARDELAGSLDAIADFVPDPEVIVVNGPSADGTTGMVQERDDVDVLVEMADRTVNAARNAGINHASAGAVALVDHTLSVTESWCEAVVERLRDHDVVTGPTHTQLTAGIETETVESRRIKGRTVTYFNGGNVAFRREPLEELDGFDEYLEIGGARDMAHRLAGREYDVTWDDRMCVRRDIGADGGERETDWGWKYRSLAYRLVKNYGVRPTVARRLVGHAGSDAFTQLRAVVRGDARPSQWLGTGRDVLWNLLGGSKDGLVARRLDRTSRRNPHGRSASTNRPVTVYDWR
jgi:glycosyltransferase involved in cell wall biosynthesis